MHLYGLSATNVKIGRIRSTANRLFHCMHVCHGQFRIRTHRIGHTQRYVVLNNTGSKNVERHICRTDRVIPVVITGTQGKRLGGLVFETEFPDINTLPSEPDTSTAA